MAASSLITAAALGLAQAGAPDAAEQAAIRTTLEAMAVYADRGDFDALERVFAEEVRLDYTALGGGEPELVSNAALMTRWAGLLPGFDRTRHALSEIEVRLDARRAMAEARVVAEHWLDDGYWALEGRYAYTLERGDGPWRISGLTLSVDAEAGSRDVLGAAAERATARPVAYLRRLETRATVRRFLTALETGDMDALNAVWAEDAVQEMPFAPAGFPDRVAGREALIAHYAGWPDTSGRANFTDHLVFHEMTDPSRVFAEFRGDVEIVPTGRRYQQRYGGLFVVENEKIVLFREYFDPAPFVYAFGLDEGGAFN